MKLCELKPDANNANKGTERGAKMVADSLREYGAGRSILVDMHGNIIAGNKTYAQALAAGNFDDVILVQTDGTKLVVVQRTDLDLKADKRAKMLGIVDNRAADVGLQWDPKIIANLQGEITLADMFTPKELESVLKTLRSKAVTSDTAPDPPPDPVTEPGDLYILGDHRLLCGDSTNSEHFDRLIDGNPIHLCWTDPPYNVAYQGSGMTVEEAKARHRRVDGLTIQNDDMPAADFRHLLDGAFANIHRHLLDGAFAYVAHSDLYGHEFRGAMETAGFDSSRCLIWVKSSFVMGRNDYHWQHEPILYAQKPGTGRWFGNRKQTTVLEFDKPGRNDVHPTMKPVALVEYCLANSSAPGDNVVDAFGGSGTTLMACEAGGRKAFLMELDRGYCDVIVSRWETATGRKAERIRE